MESTLLDAERAFLPTDGPRLLADVTLLAEYFIAFDEKGVSHGLPPDVVSQPVGQSVSQPASQPVSQSASQSVGQPASQFSRSARQPASLSGCLSSVCLSVCQSVSQSVCLSVACTLLPDEVSQRQPRSRRMTKRYP